MPLPSAAEAKMREVLKGLASEFSAEGPFAFERSTKGEEDAPELALSYRFASAAPVALPGLRAAQVTYLVVSFGKRDRALKLAEASALRLERSGWAVEMGEEAVISGLELSAWLVVAVLG